MSLTSEKHRKKLFRKRITPKLFSLFTVALINLLTLFLTFIGILMYGIGIQATQNEKKLQELPDTLMRLYSEKGSLSEALPAFSAAQPELEFIFYDKNGTNLYQNSPETINWKESATVRAFSKNKIYSDKVMDHRYGNDIPVPDLVKMIMSSMKKKVSLKSELYDEELEKKSIFYYWEEVKTPQGDFVIKNKVHLYDSSLNMAGVIIAFILVIQIIIFLIFFFSVLRDLVIQHNLTRLYYLDTVTGGNNFTHFSYYGNKLLRRKRRTRYAIVDFEILKFRSICSVYGTEKGNLLLEKADTYLRKNMKKHELCAHYSLADFALLLVWQNEQEVMQRVYALFGGLLSLVETKRLVGHAGIFYTEERTGKRKDVDITVMFNKAGAAKTSIDDNPESKATVFTEAMLKQQTWEQHIEDTMENALLREEFQVYLQPKYNPITEQMEGAEALVRWINLTDGMISPGRFIPVFEKNGFILKLDDYMISHVAKQQAEWKKAEKTLVPVSVNVSRAHFAQSDLAEHIEALVDAFEAPHNSIEIELTESAFFDDKELLLKTVHELRKKGFVVSMDDFGAGYSSLNSLKDLPLDVLKLDADFFRGDVENKRAEIVVTEAIQLAKSLNMQIVAEGIEKKEQVDFLAKQGCDMIQGYYFAKPMPIAEFEKIAFQRKQGEEMDETESESTEVASVENTDDVTEELSETQGEKESAVQETLETENAGEQVNPEAETLLSSYEGEIKQENEQETPIDETSLESYDEEKENKENL